MKEKQIDELGQVGAQAAVPAKRLTWRGLSRRSGVDFRAVSPHLRDTRRRVRSAFGKLVGLFGCTALGLGCLSATAGTIVGNVHAEGRTEAASAGGNAYASHALSTAVRVDYAAMREFLVYIDGLTLTNGLGTNTVQVNTLKVSQYHADFSPHILPILAGTVVEWPNSDDIYHNVFSVSDAAQFDLGLYKGNPPEKRVLFAQPGKVDVYCSIHQNMHCVVMVMANPYFAVTGRSGGYTITNVPAGTYHLKAWHERLPVDEQVIVVPADGEVRADFTLGIKNLPKL